MVIVLDFLGADESIVLCFEKVVILVVEGARDCTRSAAGLGNGVEVELIRGVPSLVLKRGGGKERLVGLLDVEDKVLQFPLELELHSPLVLFMHNGRRHHYLLNWHGLYLDGGLLRCILGLRELRLKKLAREYRRIGLPSLIALLSVFGHLPLLIFL